jgi:hypothetical protein
MSIEDFSDRDVQLHRLQEGKESVIPVTKEQYDAITSGKPRYELGALATAVAEAGNLANPRPVMGRALEIAEQEKQTD